MEFAPTQCFAPPPEGRLALYSSPYGLTSSGQVEAKAIEAETTAVAEAPSLESTEESPTARGWGEKSFDFRVGDLPPR